MTGWSEFALAWLVFLLSHFLPAMGLRDRLTGIMGRRTYLAVYGMVSVLCLVWLIGAAARAPFIALWSPAPWTRWVPLLAMPVAVFLAACAVGNRFPFSLVRRDPASLDPASPGLAGLSRHPLPLALAIWSGAHLPPNGDLAHVVLFGSFAALSLAAIAVFDGRARAALPPAAAAALFQCAPILSPRLLVNARWLDAQRGRLTRRLAASGVVVLAILCLHQAVIGVPPLP